MLHGFDDSVRPLVAELCLGGKGNSREVCQFILRGMNSVDAARLHCPFLTLNTFIHNRCSCTLESWQQPIERIKEMRQAFLFISSK